MEKEMETAQGMVSRRRLLQGATVAVGAVGLGAVGTSATAAPLLAYESSSWGDRDKSVGSLTTDPIVGLRTGAHPTYDRLLLDFAGVSPGGAWVGYSEAFWALGTGRPYLVGGNARILLAVWGRSDLGFSPGEVITRADQFTQRGFTQFADLVFGGTLADMNWTAFGLGVRVRKGFRVFQLGPDSAGHSRLVVDVARR